MEPNQNRPQGRRKNVTSGGNGAHRRGDGLGTGPVGSGSYSGSPTGGSGGMKRAAVGGGGLATLAIIGALIFKLLGGNGGGGSTGDLIGSLTGGGSAPAGFDFSSSDTSAGSPTSDTAVDTSVASGSRCYYNGIYVRY